MHEVDVRIFCGHFRAVAPLPVPDPGCRGEGPWL
jgi:hypothetical protein